MDQSTLELVSVFFSIVSVIALIMFFVMAGNVSAIRKILNSSGGSDHKTAFEKAVAFGNEKEAKEALEYLVYTGWKKHVSPMVNKQARQKNLDNLKDKYDQHLKSFGIEWPESLT